MIRTWSDTEKSLKFGFWIIVELWTREREMGMKMGTLWRFMSGYAK
jgi:hypothetical protein